MDLTLLLMNRELLYGFRDVQSFVFYILTWSQTTLTNIFLNLIRTSHATSSVIYQFIRLGNFKYGGQ